jgi:hypothetical protein
LLLEGSPANFTLRKHDAMKDLNKQEQPAIEAVARRFSAFHGLEAQIYHKSQSRWCLVHVHYSALPAEKKVGTE